MKIQINTDGSVEGSETLIASVQADVQSALERYAERLTRIEVHLGDKDGSGTDKRCLLEARPADMQPVVVTAFAGTVEQAVSNATRKMQSLLDSTFGRIEGRDADATIRQNEAT